MFYERVSTKRQGASGLGLEAQRKAINDFAASGGADVIARITEVESGKLADRPELAKALHLAKVTGATLLIAKLDRLSRNAAFLLTLRDSGVRFVAADTPEANDQTVGIMALVAQQEREAISRRTSEALAAAKARGVRRGEPRLRRGLQARARKGAQALREAVSRNAGDYAEGLKDVVRVLQSDGHFSQRPVAAGLNERGILTRGGRRWHMSSARNLAGNLKPDWRLTWNAVGPFKLSESMRIVSRLPFALSAAGPALSAAGEAQ